MSRREEGGSNDGVTILFSNGEMKDRKMMKRDMMVSFQMVKKQTGIEGDDEWKMTCLAILLAGGILLE